MEKFTLNKDQTVLMIVDIQEKLIPAMTVANEIIHKTNTLVSIAKELQLPIITTEQYPKGLGSTIEQIRSNIDPSYIFEKISFTAYTDKVKLTLKELGRQKILITGMETHICVFQTVRDLLSEGYEVFVVSDAICSRTKANYKNALELMRDMGAIITNTESVLFDLLKEAGTPQFKSLSKLIK